MVKKEKRSKYGSVDDKADAGNDMSTPKISHVHLLARQRREERMQAEEEQPAHQHVVTAHTSFLHDEEYDNGSLTSFGTPPGSPKNSTESNRVMISFGSLGSRIFRRFPSDASANSTLSSLVGDSVRTVVDATFRLPGKPCAVREGEETASMPNEVFNLVKNLVGAGALGLPSGVAAFANHPSALIPATVVILVMGAIFAYYFLLMGRICKVTETASYREAWEVTVGQNGAALVALFTTLMAGLGNLAYSMVLADTTRSLLMTVGVLLTRTQCLVAVTVLALWPLCMVKKLNVLAPFSFVGMGGMVFTVGAMFWRYHDGSYASGGKYIDDIPKDMKPSFGTVGASGALSLNILLLVCMNFQSYFCHYNAPRFYIELKDHTIERFGAVVATSFGISAIMYVAMASFGFLTFGAHCYGNILNNYSTRDVLATICRIAIAIALVFTYPLPFIGCRDGILDLLRVPVDKRTSQNLNVLTIIQLAVITLLAMRFQNLGLVNAVGGALFGTAVVFIFPALMFYSVEMHKREAVYAMALMYVGIALGTTGVVIAVTGKEFNVAENSTSS